MLSHLEVGSAALPMIQGSDQFRVIVDLVVVGDRYFHPLVKLAEKAVPMEVAVMYSRLGLYQRKSNGIM